MTLSATSAACPETPDYGQLIQKTSAIIWHWVRF
ncbi:hypothetical protein B0G76_1104 [Paraburkholderia sp. BL23I1N1]|nr:hypothetical protein B0G76_1104 [Paraburkholderia sp. BL23I1N1]